MDLIRILLVEDNALVRHLLADTLKMQSEFELSGEAQNGPAALDLLRNGLHADIVLADLNMEEMDGIHLTEHIRRDYKDVKVIILTMHAKAAFVNRAFAAGAR